MRYKGSKNPTNVRDRFINHSQGLHWEEACSRYRDRRNEKVVKAGIFLLTR
jgi:hypothetical protein